MRDEMDTTKSSRLVTADTVPELVVLGRAQHELVNEPTLRFQVGVQRPQQISAVLPGQRYRLCAGL